MCTPQRVFGVAVCGLLAVMLVTSGCGSGSGPLGSVTGKVTLKGEPVASGATIVFLGADNPESTLSVPIGAGGSYATPPGSGLPPGKYRVSVSPPSTGALSPEEAMKKSLQPGGMAADTSGIPAKYRNPSSSPATAEIKEGDNTFDLDMTE